MNNHNPAANVISDVVSKPKSFTYNSDVPAAPVLILPADVDTLSGDDAIVFRWTAVDGAVNYRVDIFEENDINDNQASTAVWQKYVNNPEAVLADPNGLLRNLPYTWRELRLR